MLGVASDLLNFVMPGESRPAARAIQQQRVAKQAQEPCPHAQRAQTALLFDSRPATLARLLAAIRSGHGTPGARQGVPQMAQGEIDFDFACPSSSGDINIGIFIEPDGSLAGAIRSLKAEVERQMPGQKFCSHPPHSTLIYGGFQEPKLWRAHRCLPGGGDAGNLLAAKTLRRRAEAVAQRNGTGARRVAGSRAVPQQLCGIRIPLRRAALDSTFHNRVAEGGKGCAAASGHFFWRSASRVHGEPDPRPGGRGRFAYKAF